MKHIIIIIVLIIVAVGCTSTNHLPENFSLKDEINNSIIDGFYYGDTTGVANDIYLLN